jgi:AraC family transcriptional regulator
MSCNRSHIRSVPTLVDVFQAITGRNGRHETKHLALDGLVDQSPRVAWKGGSATARQIQSIAGEVDVLASANELHFRWNSGCIDGEAQSSGKIWCCTGRPTYGIVLPPGTRAEFRIKEARDARHLSLELQHEFLLGAADFDGPVNFDVIETWDYSDPLSWQLARVIYDECRSGVPQGILYTETAATLLAMHLIRNLSTASPLPKEIRRGGLPPSRLRRACDYMMSRLGDDISLLEVASSVELSTGHFSTAFRQSLGMPPHAWLRRQRVDRAKALLRDPNLGLTHIAISLGYSNQSSLGVAFKRETGITPTQWRRREMDDDLRNRPDAFPSYAGSSPL